MTRPRVPPTKLPGPMNLLAVGGPLHGHVVTVKSTTKRVLVAKPDVVPEGLNYALDPVALAVHQKTGMPIYEQGTGGFVYEMVRLHGLLVLFETDTEALSVPERDKRFVDALITYAGLERH